MIPLLFFGQTVTPLVRLIYNHLSYPAHFQVLFNICPAKVRGARRANFDSAALPLHLSRGRSLRDGAAVPTSIPRLCRSISVAGIRFAMGPPCATSIPRLCRSISVAGIRPMEKQKQGPVRMQALFRVPVSASPHGSLPSRKL